MSKKMQKYGSILAVIMASVILYSLTVGQSRPVGSVKFQQNFVVYYKSGYTASTANETTGYISCRGVSDIALFGESNDSIRMLLYYQVRNSYTGVQGAWTAIDTLGADGLGSVPDPAGSDTLIGRAAQATILGFDEVRFFADYLTGANTGGDGGTDVVQVSAYFKPE